MEAQGREEKERGCLWVGNMIERESYIVRCRYKILRKRQYKRRDKVIERRESVR